MRVGRVLFVAAALFTAGAPVRLSAQTDTVRLAALRVAQTRPDSARAMVRRLLAGLSPQDSVYPGVLFVAGRVAADAATAATNLQRVVVEYGRSVWADSALVLLTQLYFAQGDHAATVQAAERLRLDYPDSPLRARAGFWGGRGNWTTDTPDSDLNLSFRLQQMTSMKVDPDGRYIHLTDPELIDHALRDYLAHVGHRHQVAWNDSGCRG